MADPKRRRAENAPGDFFVDASCIDCDTCRALAPDVFERVGGASAVTAQPGSRAATDRALEAVLACPTGSIGAGANAAALKMIQDVYPRFIADEVYYCGYHSEKSFGAASYFIRRPAGNVLVDSPRFARPLVRRLEEMGGVEFMFLTHRDDVADHGRFAAHFGCRRILHEDDLSSGTAAVEIPLAGREVHRLAEDLLVVPVPGHTRGHAVLLYKNFLFSGDHLAGNEEGRLRAFRSACWYSWPEQIRSMERLTAYDFAHVLPGHGRRLSAPATEIRAELRACIDWMKAR